MLGPALVLLLLCAAPAQSSPLAKVLRGEALESYETARQDFKAQRYQEALVGFGRAYGLSRDPRLLWNSAACLRKLKQNAEALRKIDAYLFWGESLSPEELAEGRRSHAALRELVATVRLAGVPSDASILVDGTEAPIQVDHSPGSDRRLYVEPGKHTFLIRKAGFRETGREATLSAGQTLEWSVELTPVEATPPAKVEPIAVAPASKLEPIAEVPASKSAPVVRRSWTPWLLVGGGAVAGAVGGALLGVSSNDYQRLRLECGSMCSPQRVAPSRSEETAGVVLVAVGSAAAVAGLGWWLFSSGTEARAQLSAAPTGVTVRGQF